MTLNANKIGWTSTSSGDLLQQPATAVSAGKPPLAFPSNSGTTQSQVSVRSLKQLRRPHPVDTPSNRRGSLTSCDSGRSRALSADRSDPSDFQHPDTFDYDHPRQRASLCAQAASNWTCHSGNYALPLQPVSTMPRRRVASTNADANSHGDADASGSQTRGLLDFLNSKIAKVSKPPTITTTSTSSSSSAQTPTLATMTQSTPSLVLHLSYRSAVQSVRVAPSLVPDMASLRLLFASVFRLENSYVREQPVYMKVPVLSAPDGKSRGSLFKLVNQLHDVADGAVLMLVDDRELLESARLQSVQRTASGRCTCDQNAACSNSHLPVTVTLPLARSNGVHTIDSSTPLLSAPSSRAAPPQHRMPNSLTLPHAHSANVQTASGQVQQQVQPQVQQQPTVQNVATNRTRAPLPSNGRPPTHPGMNNGIPSHNRDKETMQRVNERCRNVNDQLKGVKNDLRDLRRAALTFRDELNELFVGAQRQLRSLFITVPGAQQLPLRRARYEADLRFGAFERDEKNTLNDLQDLHLVVDELRLQLVANTAQKDNAGASVTESDSGVSSESGSSQTPNTKPVLLNAVELEAYSLQLEKTVADLRTNKHDFPSIRECMKPVMLGETEQLVREEQFLKTHDSRLTESLQTCQQLATLLITLKRVCALQKLDRANSLLSAQDDVSAAARRKLTLLTDPNPSHASKRAVLDNIQALCPNSDERVRAIQKNEALHRIRKRFMTAYANLQMEKLLRDKLLLAASSSSSSKHDTPPTQSDDPLDAMFAEVQKLVSQLDFVPLGAMDESDNDNDNDNDSPQPQGVASTKAASEPPDSTTSSVALTTPTQCLESNSESSSQETVICKDVRFRTEECEKSNGKKSGSKWRLLGKKRSDKKEPTQCDTVPDNQTDNKERKKERRRRSRSSSASRFTKDSAPALNDANNNSNERNALVFI